VCSPEGRVTPGDSFVARPPTKRKRFSRTTRHCALSLTALGPTAAVAPRCAAAVASAVASNDDVDELCGVMPDVCDSIEDEADAIFTIIDENGDGSISRTELTKHFLKAGYNQQAVDMVFAKLDIDGDEEITREELKRGLLRYTPLREAPGLGGYNKQYIDEIHVDADTLFAAIDKDDSGTISKEELREHLKEFSKYSFKAISKIFKLLDANRDGEIDRDELRSAFVKFSALRQAIGDGPNFK